MKSNDITEYFSKQCNRKKTHKKCCKCKVWKRKTKFGNNKRMLDGLARECKHCHNERNRWSNLSEERIQKTKLRTIKRKYGLDERQYFGRFEETNYKCPMCNCQIEPFTLSTHIDHVKGTGMMYTKDGRSVYSGIESMTRGPLCDNCNNVLARGKDNMATLVNGAKYLMKWGSRLGYLNDEEVWEYRRALAGAVNHLENGDENTWDPTYRT